MAVTRIKNNQITDSTITYAKIAPGTLVGSVFNPDLTLNSNISIIGNLSVTGTTSTVSSTNTYVNDPLVVFNNGYTGSLSGYDIGILVNRNLAALSGYGSVNTAWVWVEADGAFEALVTTDTGGGITSINNSGFANVKVGNLTAVSATITGSFSAASITGEHYGNAAFATSTATNFSTANAQITGGNAAWTTETATNFSTANAVITGGSLTGVTGSATTFTVGNLSTANAVITGGSVTGITGSATTFTATNFSTGNAQISGGNAQGLTYLQATNVSTGNAAITGGAITGMTGAFSTLQATNFSTGNAQISGGNAQGLTYLQTTNFGTGNAQIAGGNGAFSALTTLNFSTGNTLITGGTINATSIGATTPDAGFFTNTSTGELSVTGNASVGGNLSVTGNINVITGNITAINSAFFVGNTVTGFGALYAGIPSGYSVLPQVVAQFSENYDGYAQINTQNINAGGDATTDYVATANNGTDTTNYVDLGITGSGYDPLSPFNSVGTSAYPNDAYLYVQGNTSATVGGNLIIGTNTVGRVVRIISGGHDTANVVAVFNAPNTTSTNTTSGALIVTGGVGISGALNVGSFTTSSASFTTAVITNLSSGNAQITGGSITGGTGAFSTLQATNFSSGNAQISGGNVQGVTYLQATNFSTANAQITGGSITGGTGAFTTLQSTNISSGNAQISGGNAAWTTETATNFSTANAQITGGSITGITGAATTFYATNFSSGNIVGTLSGTATTANVALYENYTSSSTSAAFYPSFTDISATGNAAAYVNSSYTFNPGTGQLSSPVVLANSSAPSTSSSSGALVVTGGAGVGGNLYVGNNVVVIGNLTVQGTTTTVSSTTLDVADLNITIAKGAATAAAANGAGLTVDGPAAATILYTSATDSWTFNKQVIGQFTTSNLQSTGGAITGMTGAFSTLTATNFSTANAQISGGSITGGTGAFTTLQATNFSTGNAQVTGGNAAWTTETATNFSTANAVITGGSVTGINGAAVTFTSTNFSTGNAQITGGSITGGTGAFSTLQATNFSSGNAQISGGNAQGITYLQATNFSTGNAAITGGSITGGTGAFSTLQATNFSTGNAQVTGGSITGITGSALTFTAANLSSANAQITGGSVTNITGSATTFTATNFSSGNIVGALTGTASTANVALYEQFTVTTTNASYYPVISDRNTSGNAASFVASGISINPSSNAISATTFTGTFSGTAAINSGSVSGITGSASTFTSTNFSTGNAQITAGNVQGITYLQATNFSTGNAQITGGSITGGTGAFSTLTSTNFSTGNAQITGGSITGGTGSFTVLHANDFSSANAIISGGSLNGATIGAVTPNDATFINLNVNSLTKMAGNLVISSGQALLNANSAALVITNHGGASISGNAFVGGTLSVGDASLLTPFVNSAITAVNEYTDYAQIAIQNNNGNGSADVAAYGNNGNDTGGWVDMGFTGNTFSDPAYTITKSNDGYLFTRPRSSSFGGNLVLATSEAGSYNDIVIGVGSFSQTAEVARFHGNASSNGTFVVKLPTNAIPAANTGAFQVWGGASIGSNAYVGGSTTLGGTRAAGGDTLVQGKNDATLLWAKSGSSYDQVVIGNSAVMGDLVTGAKLQINSSDSILLPVGTNAQRPSSSGGTDVAGMMRYSTTRGGIEYYDGSAWQAPSSAFTVIADEQFSGTGSQTVFTLSTAQTTNSCIVSINGVIQIPTLAYGVTGGTTLTFTEAPAVGDVIDVRKLTTTSTVTALSDSTGYNIVDVDATGITFSTGTSSKVAAYSIDTNGAWINHEANVAVSSANTVTAIDSFSATTYRSAKYVVQATAAGKYQAMEAIVVHDDTTPQIATYGIVQTSGNLGVLTATISGGSLSVNFIAANASTTVRISREYVLI